ncbi:hypothetical protein E4U43_005918 [Claviceps pusilla]|uniref:CFEM domain-containing protein n=1 Tax=Claviceps pusilla TaxID=123648 RepID=A0A9P7N2A2_9HYPO|nr:hypothetical protein E4U43_005918 [Claviceps pusilla]
MKFSLFALSVAGLAAAQSLNGIAPCVASCIQKALGQTGCNGSPQEVAACACRAETQAKLLGPVAECATENKCTTADLLAAQKIASEQCKNGGSADQNAAKGSSSSSSSSSPMTTHSSGSLAPTLAPTSTSATGAIIPTSNANATSSGAAGPSAGLTGTRTGTGAQPSATNAAAVMGPAAGALLALFAAAIAL